MVLAAPQAPMWSARSSWWRGAPVEASGVKVERPEPQARTNDLDAASGRRRLGVWTTGWVVTRGGGCSHRVPRVGGGWGGQVSAAEASLRVASGAWCDRGHRSGRAQSVSRLAGRGRGSCL